MLNTPFEIERRTFRPAFVPALPAVCGTAYPTDRSFTGARRALRWHNAIVLEALASILTSFRSWRHRVHERRLAASLSTLNDHLLRDIGLGRIALQYADPATLFQGHG